MRHRFEYALIALACLACDDGGASNAQPCEPEAICVHTRDGQVPLAECSIGGTPGDNQAIDPRSLDAMTQYFDTRADYELGDGCALADDMPPDCDRDQTCTHVRDGVVPLEECAIGGTPGANQANDPRSLDAMTQYFDTQGDYTVRAACPPSM